jgi:hypothetical protein
MATATVFVDDAVLGALPPVCAKTGRVTEDRLVETVHVKSGVPAMAWLLLLLGPLGLVALFIYACASRDETLTVRLPFSDRAYGELSHARQRQRALGWSALAALGGALCVLIPGGFTAHAAAAALAVLGVLLLASWCAESVHARRTGVGVELDASRRWVTLTRVHDDFARAVQDGLGRAPRRPASLQPS